MNTNIENIVYVHSLVKREFFDNSHQQMFLLLAEPHIRDNSKIKSRKSQVGIAWIAVAGRQQRSTLTLLQVTLHLEIDTFRLP